MNVHANPADRRELLAQALFAARQSTGSSRRQRERDFGVGYGASSGYGRPSRYLDPAPALRFRLC